MADFINRFSRPAFWAALIFSYGAAIAPQEHAPDLHVGDKVNHMAAFFVLTILGRIGYPGFAPWRLATSLSLYGIFIELTQAIPILNRDASVADWIADTAAILVALTISLIVEKKRRERSA